MDTFLFENRSVISIFIFSTNIYNSVFSTFIILFVLEEVESLDDLVPYGYDPSKTEDEMRRENKFNPGQTLRALIPRQEPGNLLRLWSSVTSLIVVRHPLDRLVSLYNNKFIHRVEDNPLWADYAQHIKDTVREERADDSQYVTPQEMVR